MTDPDPNTEIRPGGSALALSIMFFAVTLLFVLLGAAEGVRRGTTYLRIPETGSWLVAAAITGAIGLFFLFRGRGQKRA